MLQVLTKIPININTCLLRRPPPPPGHGTLESPESDVKDDRILHRALHCAACRHRISDISTECERQGSHEHMQVNPEGITFVFGCFSAAPGVTGIGIPVTEYSWFSGYAWQIVLCGNCQIHLGWHFTSRDDQFYGLLLNMLEAG